MGERLVLDENIIYKAIVKNEDKHIECGELVKIIDEMKHILICSQNLWKRYWKIIKNIPANRKIIDEIALDRIRMILYTNGKRCIIIKKKINSEKKYVELFEQMKMSFKAYFKQNIKGNKEDLEIAKFASVYVVYALITEDFKFYEWMKSFLTCSYNLYEDLKLQQPKILNSTEALKDKKINLTS